MDGIPDNIRNDGYKMRSIMQSCRKNPNEKYEMIEDFSRQLFSSKSLKDWGLTIKSNPLVLTSKILPSP